MKEIKGYEGLYSVTEDGRVYSHLRGGGYLKSGITKNGYARVALCGHKRKRYLVHRLVAQTFIPNPENKEKVIHKDGVRTNNYISNLEWSAPFENTNLKEIKGFEGLYSATEDGRIYSHFGEGRYLKPSINNDGYYQVRLCSKEKPKTFYIHRLVALTFIPNPESKITVNHKDGVKTNNCISNLEWNTHLENIHHAFDMGLRGGGELNGFSKLKEGQVREIKKLLKEGKLTQKKIGEMFDVQGATISQINRGVNWSHVTI